MPQEEAVSLSDIDDPRFIRDAIGEFKILGQGAFLAKHGFGPSRSYRLRYEGSDYDSKAIVGVAHGYARPDLGPLKAENFSGGNATVRRLLEGLGFEVAVDTTFDHDEEVERTSWRLEVERIYTRAELKDLFGIRDRTINNGVFQPKYTSSIWLFVTEAKKAGRTQYNDHFEGEFLHWQGQTQGRTDRKIIDHRANGTELLIFFRAKWDEYPGAGFRYLGPFNYVSHEGSRPANFILRKAWPQISPVISADEASAEPFDPANIADARERVQRTIAQRRGQKAFRDALIVAYDGRCAFTGCEVRDVLEAAHIHHYRGPETNTVVNGLLLRADIHTLFDCELITVDPETLTVIVGPGLAGTEYGALHGMALRLPAKSTQHPSKDALAMHRRDSGL